MNVAERHKAPEIALVYKDCKKIHGPPPKSKKELQDSADNDIWGKSYRLVMTKVKGPRSAQPTDPKIMENIGAVIPFIPHLR